VSSGQDRGRTLGDLARTLKSANAGASWITFDMFFDRVEDLRAAEAALTPEAVGELYSVSRDAVRVYPIEALLALKVTIPRGSFLGSVEERDFDGVQQHVHLLELPV
jgi:hypothetical protein